MDLRFPLQIDSSGRTASAVDRDSHIREMIEILLFTSPGERVNRPDFGAGLLRAIFAPNSPELAAALQFAILGALQKWLGDVIDPKTVTVESEDSTIRVTVRYVVRATGAQMTDVFRRESRT